MICKLSIGIALMFLAVACANPQSSPTGPSPRHLDAEELFGSEQIISLAHAVGKSSCDEIEAAVSAGVDINFKGYEGATLLYYAFRERKLAAFECMIRLGSDVNQYLGETPLLAIAAGRPDSAYLSALLRGGADPNLRGRSTQKPALFGAIEGGLNNISILLDHGADPNAVVVRSESRYEVALEGVTAPMYAAVARRVDALLFLVENGADVCAVDSRGQSLSHYLNIWDWSRFPLDDQRIVERLREEIAEC